MFDRHYHYHAAPASDGKRTTVLVILTALLVIIGVATLAVMLHPPGMREADRRAALCAPARPIPIPSVRYAGHSRSTGASAPAVIACRRCGPVLSWPADHAGCCR